MAYAPQQLLKRKLRNCEKDRRKVNDNAVLGTIQVSPLPMATVYWDKK